MSNIMGLPAMAEVVDANLGAQKLHKSGSAVDVVGADRRHLDALLAGAVDGQVSWQEAALELAEFCGLDAPEMDEDDEDDER